MTFVNFNIETKYEKDMEIEMPKYIPPLKCHQKKSLKLGYIVEETWIYVEV